LGKKGKEIVEAELDIDEVIDDLNTAVANEWTAAYFYWAAANVIQGIAGEEVAEYFRKQVQDELGHASELANRIAELGGVPVDMIGKVEGVAKEKLTVPSNYGDAPGFLRKALEFEGKVIGYYNNLAKKYFGKDHATYALVSRILASEVREEEELETLLGGRR